MKNAHLEILLRGVKEWNDWRAEEQSTRPDLSGADLCGRFLEQANFISTNLSGANLKGACLGKADFHSANLSYADLSEADLSDTVIVNSKLTGSSFNLANLYKATFANVAGENVTLVRANFGDADLSQVRIGGANLYNSNFRGARLSSVDLSGAKLAQADFREAILISVWLSDALLQECQFGDGCIVQTNLSTAVGLDTILHYGPTSVDFHTLSSLTDPPLGFLRGCGLPDVLIEYLPALLNKPFQFYSCFISYSEKDSDFVTRLHADLQNAGVRCWFAPEDMKIGAKIRDEIDRSIRVFDKLLIILSKNSVKSSWVEKEVETAFEEERKRDGIVLFPIRVDNEVMETGQAWAADIRRGRHIGNFQKWKDHDEYKKSFQRLLRDLRGHGIRFPETENIEFDDDIPF